MVILSLVVKRTRVKALVKNKRAALEAFGTYVEVGDVTLSTHFFFTSKSDTLREKSSLTTHVSKVKKLGQNNHFSITELIEFNIRAFINDVDETIFFMMCIIALKSMAGDTRDKPFLKRALRGVRTIICPNVSIYILMYLLQLA